jgi:hypothetical protein
MSDTSAPWPNAGRSNWGGRATASAVFSGHGVTQAPDFRLVSFGELLKIQWLCKNDGGKIMDGFVAESRFRVFFRAG